MNEIVICGDIVTRVRNHWLGESRRGVAEIEDIGIGIVEKPQGKFVRNVASAAAVGDVEILLGEDPIQRPLRRDVFEGDLEEVVAQENVKNRGIGMENGSPILV